MSIITIASSKGGAGKTTIARLLLGHAARHGMTAAALDADLNHSLTDWIKQHKAPFEVRAEIDETRIVPTVSALHEQHDLVVIDTAGAATRRPYSRSAVPIWCWCRSSCRPLTLPRPPGPWRWLSRHQP